MERNLPNSRTDTAGEDAPVAKRSRRPAEEARRLILDAAEKRLAEQGPEGIRLQDIARDIGISHPAILHHFESREGLVRALIERASQQLLDTLLKAFEVTATEKFGVGDTISKVFEVLSDRGTARLWSWLHLTGRELEDDVSTRLVREISEQLHALRVLQARDADVQEPGWEDTLFITILVASTAFGDAIIGQRLTAGVVEGADGRGRFRQWFAKLLVEHGSAVRQPKAG